MKKLNLQLNSIKEMLSKEQMKKIVGGYGNDNCIGTYFYSGSDGCGTLTCTGWSGVGSNCICTKTITVPPPCGYA